MRKGFLGVPKESFFYGVGDEAVRCPMRRSMKKTIRVLISVGFLISAAVITVQYYSYLFAKVVVGEVIRVEHVSQTEAVIACRNTPSYQLFSYAIAIRDSQGVIHTASSEDRQWAVVSAGQCARAKFFPYPPWRLDKGGTYFGARLEELRDCRK